MGLFNRNKKNRFYLFRKKKKKIYEYKIMEPVDCDLDEAINNPNPGFDDYCKLIAESSDYLFYSYKTCKDNSGGYVIRRSKSNLSEKIFFGKNYQLSQVYKDYLFQCSHSGERGLFYIFAKNINTGQIIKCDWLGKGNIFVNINRYGRFYVQDTIKDMAVINDKLTFYIKRQNSGTMNPYDIDTDYTLQVTIENGIFKPVAFFDKDFTHVEDNASNTNRNKNETHQQKNKSTIDELGRDESKHISCGFEGYEDDCPYDCDKCAISIKTNGDQALAEENLDVAIKQYKRAVFIEPKFAEAWVSIGNIYEIKSEYNNAIAAYDKAISIDPKYGKALFCKATTLKKQGNIEDAIVLLDKILNLYDNSKVKKLKETLINSGNCDIGDNYSLEKVIDIMTDKTYEIFKENNLLNSEGKISTIKEIYFKEEFAVSVFSYCNKRYGYLGKDKVWSESILTAFYGSLCTTILYYRDKNGFKNITPFDYLTDHINIDELDRSAEKLLNIRQNEKETEKLWNLIYSYVTFCKSIIKRVKQEQDIKSSIMYATESAYIMGMLYAMRYNERKSQE